MTSLRETFYQAPLLQDMEALYQRVYGTAERRKKTDRFLFAVIAAMSLFTFLQIVVSHAACGVGAV